MNRLILKYGYPITAVILVIFAWVVYRRIAQRMERDPSARRRGGHRVGAWRAGFHLPLAAHHGQRL